MKKRGEGGRQVSAPSGPATLRDSAIHRVKLPDNGQDYGVGGTPTFTPGFEPLARAILFLSDKKNKEAKVAVVVVVGGHILRHFVPLAPSEISRAWSDPPHVDVCCAVSSRVFSLCSKLATKNPHDENCMLRCAALRCAAAKSIFKPDFVPVRCRVTCVSGENAVVFLFFFCPIL